MKCAINSCSSWTRGRFIAVVGVLFILQAGLLFLFGDHSGPRPRLSALGFDCRALDASVGEDELLRQFFVGDPAVFPLPNPRGFSGRGWLNRRTLDFQTENQLEPPVWLPLDTVRLGTNFPGLAPDSERIPLSLVEQPISREEPLPVFLTPVVIPTQSILRVEGGLGVRLLGAPALQTWSNAQLLTKSAVRIAVDPAGQVVSARLEAGCGRSDADADAVAKARALRFRSSWSAGTRWGEAVFQWQTAAAAAISPLK